MKRKILDHEISSLLLGELNDEESTELKKRLYNEDGNLDRIDRLKKKDEAFLARFPSQVFAAQVASELRKKSYEVQNSKHTNKKREDRMIIGKRVLLGVAALTMAGLFANNIHSKLENEVSFVPPENIVNMKPIKNAEGLRTPRALSRNFDADFRLLQKQVKGETDPEKIVSFRAFLTTHILEGNQDEILWVHDKYATLLEKNDLSGTPSAASVRTKIVQTFTDMSEQEKEKLRISKEGIAKSLFMDTEEKLLKMTAMLGAVGASGVVMEPYSPVVLNNLKAVIGLEIPRWSVAAYFRLATLNLDEANSMRRASSEFEGFAKGVEVEALDLLKKGLEISGVQSSYFDESRLRFEKLKTRVCPREKELETLHSMIWHIEHSSTSTAKMFVKGIGPWSVAHFPELVRLKEKVVNDTPSVELHTDAEALRAKTEDWICMSQEMHVDFDQRIEKEPFNDGESANRDSELVKQAMKLMFSGKFSEVIEKCDGVEIGCERLLAISYKNIGDAENACKYMRLAGLSSMRGVKCEGVKSVDKRLTNDGKQKWGTQEKLIDIFASNSSKQVLTRTDISSTIQQYRILITSCAQHSNDKNLAGAVKVGFSLKPNGHVIDVRVRGSFAGTDVGRCLKKVVAGMKFHKRQSTKNQKISYPFMIGKQRLTRSDVKSTIRIYGGRITDCGKDFNPKNLDASVKVSFYVKPNGRVTGAKVRGVFVGTDVGRCVQKVVAGMKFPKTQMTKNQKLFYPFLIR